MRLLCVGVNNVMDNADSNGGLRHYDVNDVDAHFLSQHVWHFRNDASGFGIMKPYFLLRALVEAHEGELVALVPVGFATDDTLEERLNAWLGDAQVAVTPSPHGLIECDGTKRDLYVLLDINANGCHNCSTRYDSTVQASAAIVVCRAGLFAIRFIAAWLTLCGDRRAVNHDADVLASTVRPPSFKRHTQAQAVLSLLAKKWHVPIRTMNLIFPPSPPLPPKSHEEHVMPLPPQCVQRRKLRTVG